MRLKMKRVGALGRECRIAASSSCDRFQATDSDSVMPDGRHFALRWAPSILGSIKVKLSAARASSLCWMKVSRLFPTAIAKLIRE
jgi:hypothetical protein